MEYPREDGPTRAIQTQSVNRLVLEASYNTHIAYLGSRGFDISTWSSIDVTLLPDLELQRINDILDSISRLPPPRR